MALSPDLLTGFQYCAENLAKIGPITTNVLADTIVIFSHLRIISLASTYLHGNACRFAGLGYLVHFMYKRINELCTT